MNDFILKLTAKLLGEDLKKLRNSSVKSKQKVITSGVLLILPMLTWMISAALMCEIVFKTDSYVTALSAIVAGMIVLILDTSFMKAKSGGWMKTYRFTVVLLSCLIGSVSIDLAVFHDDIDQYIKTVQGADFKMSFNANNAVAISEIEVLNQEYDKRKLEVEALREEFYAEMDGHNKSGSGYGVIAKQKKLAWQDAANELDSFKADLDNKSNELNQVWSDGLSRKFESSGILTHLRALLDLSLEKPIVLISWIVLFLFIALVEYSPVFVKHRFGETDYDKWKDLQETIKNHKIAMLNSELKAILCRIKTYTDQDISALNTIQKLS